MLYRHVLVALDGHADRSALLQRAKGCAELFGARLSVLSVVPPALAAMPMTFDLAVPVVMAPLPGEPETKILLDQARDDLRALCTANGVPDADIYASTGVAHSTILDVAHEIAADLLVIGHHHHRGLSGLFSHTDENVVGKAVCDVLVVVLAAAAN